MKPDRIILWLADTQFPEKEKGLPDDLRELIKYGLEIRWCEDLKSYKKLIPSLREFPNAIVVTADDDIYYRSTWLSVLYEAYLSDPHTLWVHRITKFIIYNGEYKTIAGGDEIWDEPSYLNKLTGGSGCLYAPGNLNKNITNSKLFMNICPTNDDIWFWLMAVLNKTKVMSPHNKQSILVYVPGTQEGQTLTKVNDHGAHLFWKDFHSVMDHYPILDNMLREEYNRMTKQISEF